VSPNNFGIFFAYLEEKESAWFIIIPRLRGMMGTTKLKKEITMKTVYFLAGVSMTIWFAACATIRGAGDVTQGRQALLAGDYQRAVGLFQDAERTDPTYVYGTELKAGVSSYLGRTQYLTGNYTQARQTLEKALSQDRSDNVARLYLGLTLYRLGDQKAGLTNIERGMQGIYNWLQYIDTNFRYKYGNYWDTGGTIEGSIKSNLAMISSGKIDWPQLIADGESLGIGIEQEEAYFLDFYGRRGGSS
jgi:tetratricopeptide (TPR) repeat protein